MIGAEANIEVFKVTGIVVKQAVSKMKANKTDVSSSFVSDALKHAQQ